MLSGGDEAAVEEAMGGVLQLLGIGPGVPDADASDFDPVLVNCDGDLAGLTERLVLPGASRQWSLCLSGPPGTGKSQFARYLAARLGMEVMQQRASSLLIDVGRRKARSRLPPPSRRLAHAAPCWSSTKRTRCSPTGAKLCRSWEVTQVNEMLTWMESHPLPFVCTTNLMDRLDQASLRRFTLKLRFASLSPAQTKLAFERFFGIVALRATRRRPDPRATSRPCAASDLLGVTDPSMLADWLDEEAEAKGAQVRRIGFAAARD